MIRSVLRLVPMLLLTVLVSAQQIQVRINSRLSSDSTPPGTEFRGVLMNPVQLNGYSCAKGSAVGGVVTNAKGSGRLSGPGVLEVQPSWVSCRGRRVNVSAAPVRLEGRSHTKRNAILIGGGAGAGAILGGIFGGGKGALIGAAAGAGAGTVTAAATGKREAVIEPEAMVAWNLSPSSQAVQTATNHPPQASEYRHSDRHARRDDDDHDRYDRDDDDDRGDRDRHEHEGRYENVRFTDHDRAYLSRCLVSNYRLPPGLAKQGKIPPGHARKMREAGYTAIPGVCMAELSPIPDGWQRVIIDTRVVLLDAARREIDSFIWQAEDRGE